MSSGQQAPVAVIGDVVASRTSEDRRRLHRSVRAALGAANDVIDHLEPLEVTVGDEFQGLFATVGSALDAVLRVRLALLPEVDTRFGVGRGATATVDAKRGIKDGPAWWAARDAIVDIEQVAERAALAHARTAYRLGDGESDGDGTVQAVNAALECQDHMVGSVSERSLRLLRGLLDGMTQRELAGAEGITPSAVSQRVRADGLAVIVRSHDLLRAMP